jgi:hypothetical protein
MATPQTNAADDNTAVVMLNIKPDAPGSRTTSATKVQKYSNDGKTLLTTYAGYADVFRDQSFENISINGLKNAVTARTPYKGYRWATLSGEQPDDTVQDIGVTNRQASTRATGRVAVLNPAGTVIEEVFADQKAASAALGVTQASVSTMLKKEREGKTGGKENKLRRRVRLLSECTPEQQKAYVDAHSQLPELPAFGVGQPVEKVDPTTGSVIKRYPSLSQARRDMMHNHEMLKRAIEKGEVMDGALWRFVPRDD